MTKLSVIIPSRGEIFLNKTIEDLLNKAKGEIEIIATLDNYYPEKQVREFWSTPERIEDPRVTYLHFDEPQGIRIGVNKAVAMATGDYIMKLDAHCMFEEGFDVILEENMQDNWVVIPRRYSLDAEKWEFDRSRPIRDYHYLCYPDPNKNHDQGMHGVEWKERSQLIADSQHDMDDNMCFQGSCWFMRKQWFTEFMGGMDENPIYHLWAQEPTEISLKTWLGGGEVKINKKISYAHLHKGKRYGRMYKMDEKGVIQGHNFSANYWMNNSWPKQIHQLKWLVDKFAPVPTWPNNYVNEWDEKGKWRISLSV